MISSGTELRNCLACSKPLKGRADKKFCDDYCRSNYNNKLKPDAHPLVRKINNILRKNRRILQELLPAHEETVKTTKYKLAERGFNFTHFTHTYTNRKGALYYFCYDYGWLPLEKDWCVVVKRNKD